VPCFVGLRARGELVAPGAYALPVHREQPTVDRLSADDARHLAGERNVLPWPEVGVGFRVHRKLEHELSVVGGARYRRPVPVAVQLPVKLGIEVGEANVVTLDVVESEERSRVSVVAALVHRHHSRRTDSDVPMEHVVGKTGEGSDLLRITLSSELGLEILDAQQE